MSRGLRQAPGGIVYHALNRAVARLPLFEKPADYEAFLRVLAEALDEHPIRILAFVLMPNHWHFVLCPERDQEGDQDLTDFLRWLTHTHDAAFLEVTAMARYHQALTDYLAALKWTFRTIGPRHSRRSRDPTWAALLY